MARLITAKELAETRFWIRLVVRRNWIPSARVESLLDELEQIRLIVGSILTKTKAPSNQGATARV